MNQHADKNRQLKIIHLDALSISFSAIENINETKNNKYALPDHPCEQPSIMTINNTVIDNF